MSNGLKPLRPLQVTALEMLRDVIRSGARRPMLQASTGFGKTVLAAHIIAGVRQRNKRVAFCVPALGLVNQSFSRFVENGLPAVEMGVMQGDHPWRRPHAPIQIATAQTLQRRALPNVDVAVLDEAHELHEVYRRWMEESPQTLFIGLSATPWSRGLGLRFDRLVKPTNLRELIDQGYLSKFRVYAPSHPDLTSVKVVAGDYHEGQLGEVMSKPKLVADIVSTWLTMGAGRPTLCYAVNLHHARLLHDRFAEAGVRVAYVDANTPGEERDVIGRRLAAGEIQVAVNVGTLTRGIDWDVRCIILARPTRSEMLFVQIIGRGLRTADGKDDCLILDHSDTHQKLGMVTDIDHAALDMGEKLSKKEKQAKQQEQPLPTCCPSCSALMPPGSRACGSCGSTLPLIDPVIGVAGELVELGNGNKAATTSEKWLAQQPRREIYAQLLSIRIERQYLPVWVDRAFKDIFGVWPRGLGAVEPYPASQILKSWIRERAKAFAKRKKAEEAAA